MTSGKRTKANREAAAPAPVKKYGEKGHIQYRLLMRESGRAILQFGVLCDAGEYPTIATVRNVVGVLQACERAMSVGERAFVQARIGGGASLGAAAHIAASAMQLEMESHAAPKPVDAPPESETSDA